MQTFARCIRDESWPGYHRGIHYMSQPTWAAKMALERAMTEEGGADGE
jgi:hypothetical protein